MEAMREPLLLLEIERELAGPDRAAALERHDKVLADLSARIDAAMREGLPPEDFQKVSMLQEATTTARKILRLAVRVDG